MYSSIAACSGLLSYWMQALFGLDSSRTQSPLAVPATAPLSFLSHRQRSSGSSTVAHHLESSAGISLPSGSGYSSRDFDLVCYDQRLIFELVIWQDFVASLVTCC